MANASEKLANNIKTSVFASQANLVHKLKGKYVERDGTTFLVVSVDWRKGRIIVSDTKTPVKQTTYLSIRSFLSKAVEIIEE